MAGLCDAPFNPCFLPCISKFESAHECHFSVSRPCQKTQQQGSNMADLRREETVSTSASPPCLFEDADSCRNGVSKEQKALAARY